MHDLKIVLQKLLEQRKNNPEWAAADQPFQTNSKHPLDIFALSTNEEITNFINQTSIFSPEQREATDLIDRLTSFRQWLSEHMDLDTLFEGKVEVMLELAQKFVHDQVYSEVSKHSVLDILIQMDEPVLLQRLGEAATAIQPLVRFSDQLADELKERWLVSVYWRSAEQRDILERAIIKIFGPRCVLIPSKDSTEIVIFYYADGLPISAVTDLTGHCLDALLKQRSTWQRQIKLGEQVSNPIYSGNAAMQRVVGTGVIRRLYEVRGRDVTPYTAEELPELANQEETTF